MNISRAKKQCLGVLSIVILAWGPQVVLADFFLMRWPATLLSKNDNLHIYELVITLKCGEFKAVHNIPDNWNVEIIRPISGISELHAEAGQGASNIPSLADFNEIIKIGRRPENSNCFELSATVSRFGADTAINVKHEEFTLIRVQ